MSPARARNVAGEPPWLPEIRIRLEERISFFARNGCGEAAVTCRRDLEIVEAAARAWWLEELPREQAAREARVSTDTIDRRARRGELTKLGRGRVRRAELWSPPLADEASVYERRADAQKP